MPTLQPATSTARCTGRLVTGTSASIAAIRIVTTSTSGVHTSMPPIVVDTPGTLMAVMDTTTDTGITTVRLTTGITSVCTTAGIAVTSATHRTTAQLA